MSASTTSLRKFCGRTHAQPCITGEFSKKPAVSDETFFAFGDDADLGMRARLLAWSAWYVPTAVVHHRHSASFGAYSPLKVMLVERNRVLLAIKNFPWPLLLQNPFWTLRRLFWNAYGAFREKGRPVVFWKRMDGARSSSMFCGLTSARCGYCRTRFGKDGSSRGPGASRTAIHSVSSVAFKSMSVN